MAIVNQVNAVLFYILSKSGVYINVWPVVFTEYGDL
jgi:hypothetical protein